MPLRGCSGPGPHGCRHKLHGRQSQVTIREGLSRLKHLRHRRKTRSPQNSKHRGKSIHKLFHIVGAVAAARGTTGGSRPGTTAASSPYRMVSEQEADTKPQQTQLQLQGTRPGELPHGCSSNFTDHVVKTNSSQFPFGTCRSHSPTSTKLARRNQENVATVTSGGPVRGTQTTSQVFTTSHSPTDKVTASSAKTAHASVGRHGQAASTPPTSNTAEEGPRLPERYASSAPQSSKQSLKQTFKQKEGVVRPLAEQARPAPKHDKSADRQLTVPGPKLGPESKWVNKLQATSDTGASAGTAPRLPTCLRTEGSSTHTQLYLCQKAYILMGRDLARHTGKYKATTPPQHGAKMHTHPEQDPEADQVSRPGGQTRSGQGPRPP